MSGSTVAVRTPRGELRLELPLPGLYNVYNALAALAAALELGVDPQRAAAALADVRAAFGRVETIEVGGTPVSILLIKNPAGANEVLRTLRLEAGGEGLDLWIALNDRIADGRDVSWVWDADFELLARLGAPRHLRRHAGAGDGAAAEVRRLAGGADRGRAGDRAPPSTTPSPPRPSASSPSPPTPPCSSCASCSPRGAWRRSSGSDARTTDERRGDLARRRVRRLRGRPRALARARRLGRRARSSTSAAAPAGSPSTSPGTGTGCTASTSTRRSSPPSTSARRPPGCRPRRPRATPATSPSTRSSRW